MASEDGCPERYRNALRIAAKCIRDREGHIARIDGILCDHIDRQGAAPAKEPPFDIGT